MWYSGTCVIPVGLFSSKPFTKRTKFQKNIFHLSNWSWKICKIRTIAQFEGIIWKETVKKRGRPFSGWFLGRAWRSRDGLTESRLHRRCRRAGLYTDEACLLFGGGSQTGVGSHSSLAHEFAVSDTGHQHQGWILFVISQALFHSSLLQDERSNWRFSGNWCLLQPYLDCRVAFVCNVSESRVWSRVPRSNMETISGTNSQVSMLKCVYIFYKSKGKFIISGMQN